MLGMSKTHIPIRGQNCLSFQSTISLIYEVAGKSKYNLHEIQCPV